MINSMAMPMTISLAATASMADGERTPTVNGGAGNDTLYGGLSYGSARGTFTDTLDGGDGDDVLNPIGDYLNYSSYGDRAVLTGGLGADRFVFDYLVSGSNSPVAAPDRITDFNGRRET
jgi:Ca2+-binding RTX toxin-like protein